MAKLWVSSYGPKCCQPIKLQGSLKCNISRKKWIMNFTFGMQINIDVFVKLILSFWLCIIRHAQSTQNKFAYFCSISKKAWAMKLIFYLQINTNIFYKLIVSLRVCVARHAQSTQHNIFAICQGKRKGWSWFFPADNCQTFLQSDTAIFDVFDQTRPNYPKQKVCYSSAIS